MKRTKINDKPKDITSASPLAEDIDGFDSPAFLEKLKSGIFDKEDIKNPHGGPPKLFKNDFMRQVYYLARLGARTQDIAEFFCVQPITVDKWKQKNPDFQEAWAQGHFMFGMKVGETLGHRALGYDYTETEYSQHVDRQGNIRNLKKTTHKHMAPDTVAIIFYLKNRFRDSWADVNRMEVDSKLQVDITKKLDMVSLTDDEKQMIKSIAIKNISTLHGVTNN